MVRVDDGLEELRHKKLDKMMFRLLVPELQQVKEMWDPEKDPEKRPTLARYRHGATLGIPPGARIGESYTSYTGN